MAICTIINFSRCQNKMNLFKSMNSCLNQIFFNVMPNIQSYTDIFFLTIKYNTSNRWGTVVLIYPCKPNGDSSSKTMDRMVFFFYFFHLKRRTKFCNKNQKKKIFCMTKSKMMTGTD